jgi:glucose/mannose transport system permease protein
MKLARAVSSWLLAALCLIFAFPLLVMVMTSLKSLAQINEGSLLSPVRHPTLAAWASAWDRTCIGGTCHGISTGIVNSLAIVIPALAISLCLGSITGFALSLRTSRYANLLFTLLLVGLFIPMQVTLYPMIVALRELRLFGTRSGLVMVHVIWGLPLLSLLFRNFFLSVPRGVLNAARIDGVGFFGIFWGVALPISAPICVAAVVLQFTFLWNDFFLGLIFSGSGNEPVTVALNVLVGAQLGPQQYNINMAAAMIAAAPTILLYLLTNRLFTRGVTVMRHHG